MMAMEMDTLSESYPRVVTPSSKQAWSAYRGLHRPTMGAQRIRVDASRMRRVKHAWQSCPAMSDLRRSTVRSLLHSSISCASQ